MSKNLRLDRMLALIEQEKRRAVDNLVMHSLLGVRITQDDRLHPREVVLCVGRELWDALHERLPELGSESSLTTQEKV